MWEWAFSHGERLTVVVLLLLIIISGGVAFITEQVFLAKTVRRWLDDKDEEIDRAHRNTLIAEERSERLLAQLERIVRVQEDATEIAATSVRRTDPVRQDRRRT